MKRASQEWKDRFFASLKPATDRGDYKTALGMAKKGLREFPDEFATQYQYAKLLGDYADELPDVRKAKLKREAVTILRPLLRRLGGVPWAQRFGVCLNYYYQSEDFRGMYAFGRRFVKTNHQRGLYAQGLATGLIASELLADGQKKASTTWAKKSVKAWRKYHLAKDIYYFAHYSAAKSFALSGDRVAALQHLKRASKLAKRPITDWEFADVLKILKQNEGEPHA